MASTRFGTVPDRCARSFDDLVADIAAEELGHVELVAGSPRTLLDGGARVRRWRDRVTGRSTSPRPPPPPA
ncbi:MAG TPA: hypothetical protein VNT03_15360 [Baekduia sp.]|nr:hypothetical protein [Baekduia sp.]